MIKVVKFGGSSLASAEQFKKVGRIIRQEEDVYKRQGLGRQHRFLCIMN